MEITVKSKAYAANVKYNISFEVVKRGGIQKIQATCVEKSRVWEVGRDEADALRKITHTLEHLHE